MGEEQYPDGLSAEEWETIKGEYRDEYDNLVASCLKKDGTARKDAKADDVDRLNYLTPWFTVTTEPVVTISDGDVFRHYAEREFYLVTGNDGESAFYVTVKGPSYVPFQAEAYDSLRKRSETMLLANMVGLVTTGKWIAVTNLSAGW